LVFGVSTFAITLNSFWLFVSIFAVVSIIMCNILCCIKFILFFVKRFVGIILFLGMVGLTFFCLSDSLGVLFNLV
jgi:hypothetical protein